MVQSNRDVSSSYGRDEVLSSCRNHGINSSVETVKNG